MTRGNVHLYVCPLFFGGATSLRFSYVGLYLGFLSTYETTTFHVLQLKLAYSHASPLPLRSSYKLQPLAAT